MTFALPSSSPPVPRRGRRWPAVEFGLLWLGAAVAAALVLAVAALDPAAGLAALAGVVVMAVVVARPERGAYLFLAFTPLLAGFERGSFVPMIRPSEGLLVVVAIGVVVRYVIDGLAGHRSAAVRSFGATDIGRSIVAMAILSSFVPLVWRAARGYRPLSDDYLFATTLWKYLVVFLLFRLVVVRRDQVWRCVTVMVGVGVIVGAVAIVQSVNLAGVPQALARVYGEPIEAVANNRGSSTLGTSHGVGDVMAFDLALCLALWWYRVGDRRMWAVGSVFFALACFASGQFSAWIALVLVAVVFGVLTGVRVWRTLAVAIPGIVVAGAALWPVVATRLESTSDNGLPSSWDARYINLSNYFWPELFSGFNWALGVRPAGRVPSYEPWREFVYIESGHTWLLWTGGIPLALAFCWFTVVAWRAGVGLVRSGSTGLGSAVGMTAAVALVVVFVLMLFDVHLTLRGAADALFPLLALVTVRALWADPGEYREAVGGRAMIGPRLQWLLR